MPPTNNVAGIVNFVAMLLSIPIIGTGVWLSSQPASGCVKLLQWPVIVAGVLVLVVGVAGFVGGFWRIPWLVVLYLVAMLALIALLVALVALVYTVTNQGSGHQVPSRSYMEYHLDDYSGWLKRRVNGDIKWDRIKECIASTSICNRMNYTYPSPEIFFNSPISPIQSGCCKPPTMCGFTFLNPTNWISPIDTAADADCVRWSNDEAQLCYACNSCRAGMLASLRKEWRKAELVLVLTLVAIIVVYAIGCCAFRNAKTEEIFSRYKQGYT